MTNHARILKNTLFLYVRMAFIMAISVYTSRVILDALGSLNYGIYSVVAGLTISLGFLGSSLSNATQRFLNYELGKDTKDKLQQIFVQSFWLYLIISIVLSLIGGCLGYYLIVHKLTIPQDRINAALWVLFATIFSLFFTLNGIVYNAILVAHEHFNVYAYIGGVEALLKLVIALIISHLDSFDRLIVYSLLSVTSTIFIQVVYMYYCTRRYSECKIICFWNNRLAGQLLRFIGWNGLGGAVWSLSIQGVDFLVNLFFGPIVNAARTISLQVETAVGNLNGGFIAAVKPQVVKAYAAGQQKECVSLLFSSTRHSFTLMWILGFPIIMNKSWLLDLWLVEVPRYVPEFLLWGMLAMLANSLTIPIWNAIQAVGDLKKYSLITNGIYALVFPLGYLFYYNGGPVVSPIVIILLARIAQTFSTALLLRRYLPFSFKSYIHKSLIPISLLGFCSFFSSWGIRYSCSFVPIGELLIDVIFVLLFACIFGLSSSERKEMFFRVKSIYISFKH